MVTVDMVVEAAIMVTSMGIVDTDTMVTAALVDTVVIMEIPVVTRATIDNKKCITTTLPVTMKTYFKFQYEYM